MQVRELMTNNPACCTPDSTLQEVARLMVENDCGCIPVVNDQSNKKPVGTITDRDITIRTVAAGQNPVPMKASDIMSIDIATVKPDQTLEECLKAMEEKDIRRILVVDEGGRCCGIVAQEDVVRSHSNPVRTSEFLREISSASPSGHMTMSKDVQGGGGGESSLSARSFLPILVGIGSGAALSYFFGKRSGSGEEARHQPKSQFTAGAAGHANTENSSAQVGSVTRPAGAAQSHEAGGRFEIKPSTNGKFHFNLKSGNGETILAGELYETRSGAEKGIASVKKNAAAGADAFERKTNKNGEPYFVLKAGNGEVIGTSETFSSEAAMEKAISSVMRIAPVAVISTTAS